MHAQVLKLISFRSSCLLTSTCKNGICDAQRNQICRLQVATISSKLFRDRSVQKPKPWPYETKKYNYFRAIFDSTQKRFDENTKIVVVEGNIASGKSSLAKTIADELEMRFMPEVTMDQLYVFEDGFNFRQLDHLLPESFKCCDVRTFYENPFHNQVPYFQMTMFRLRFEQYLDALAHLLNTGQGVVLERCAYSDFVFVEAMHKHGYISKRVKDYYYKTLTNCMFELLKPHLVLYLDVPSDILLERIKKRNIPYEVNSKVLTKDYLDSIEYYYKHVFLKDISTHAELLVYDWTNYADPEVVIEDIERINFDKYDYYDSKLNDWRIDQKWDWNNLRMRVTNKKGEMMLQTHWPTFDVPEILATAHDTEEYVEIINKYVPQLTYFKGYNPFAGDKYLFKTGLNYREAQKFTLPFYR